MQKLIYDQLSFQTIISIGNELSRSVTAHDITQICCKAEPKLLFGLSVEIPWDKAGSCVCWPPRLYVLQGRKSCLYSCGDMKLCPEACINEKSINRIQQQPEKGVTAP